MLISVGVTTQKENTAIVGHLTLAYSASFQQLTHEGFVCFTFLLFVIFFGVLRENNYFQFFNIISSGKKFLVLIFADTL